MWFFVLKSAHWVKHISGTGGAIAAPASETIATGLEEGIEYEAPKKKDCISFFFGRGDRIKRFFSDYIL